MYTRYRKKHSIYFISNILKVFPILSKDKYGRNWSWVILNQNLKKLIQQITVDERMIQNVKYCRYTKLHNNEIKRNYDNNKRYSNGSFTFTESLQLSGTIAPGTVVVITNGQTDSVWVSSGGYWSLPIDSVLYALGDIHDGSYPAVCYFNGDDAITLETMSNVFIDIFGKIGEDPGGAWTNDASAGYTDANGGKWLTRDYTLIRKSSVDQGVTTNPSEFNTLAEYDTLPKNFWDSLGHHTCVCNPISSIANAVKEDFVLLFPNPVVNQEFTLKATEIIESAEIMNLLGQSIGSFQNDKFSGEMTIKLNDLREGIYLAKVKLRNQKFLLKKIIIK
jgi:hypothetical protein